MADALLIFKPDTSYRLAARTGIWTWLKSEREWTIEALTWFHPTAELIESHYDFLKDKPFFPWLVDFMTALPLVVGRVTAGPESLERMRFDLGETQIQKSRPGSLRERFGIYGGVNCMHLSDAPETGAAEVAKWLKFVTLDNVDVDLDGGYDNPDHTYRLRSLATQVSAGIHVDLASAEIKTLLAEETDMEEAQLDALFRITIGALS